MEERMKKILVVVSLLVLATVGVSYGASTGKIGCVDLGAVQARSRWGDMIRQEMKRETDKAKVQLEPKANAFKEKVAEFEKKKAVLDEKARTKQQQELATMQQDAQRLIEESQKRVGQMQEQLIPPFKQKLMEVAKQVALKDGYDLIVDKAVLLHVSDKDDLTTKVISELDKVTPSTLPTGK
jgi:Skp family chaperone for outer membrane proteins